ncbi:MAG: Trm112 family protein [Microthrixaceae bacterium]|nr:Trm112 family protein [Microthrixaceae bacterium]MCO5313796.1 Trm112 family protein [Microthrixaceae bacterium]HPB46128.1 Trm112 family protein [Microthrixaceae bacterium]
MAISDDALLEFLACPQDKGPLLYLADEDLLYNPRLKVAYAIKEGIPVMLASEATSVSEDEHQRIVAKAESAGAKS